MRQMIDAICWVALMLMGAIPFISCKESIEKTDALDVSDSLSTWTVYNMNAIEIKFGKVSGSLEAPLMKTYSLLAEPFEIFPNGIKAKGYTIDNQLETEIAADVAIHRSHSERERWEVYGNVVIINHLKNEIVKTDTLYWDRVDKRIYTHCFVKMTSPQGLMQGFGMESDERASNVTILRPFDSYGIIVRDTVPQFGEI